MALFVLVHSPLVGPVTWSWVADELRRRGHRVVVPTLTEAVLSGGWEACVAVVAEAAPGDEQAVLVGHSGAGPLLPVIARQMAAPPWRLVFVDAAVPPWNGDAPLVPDQFLPAEYRRTKVDCGDGRSGCPSHMSEVHHIGMMAVECAPLTPEGTLIQPVKVLAILRRPHRPSKQRARLRVVPTVRDFADVRVSPSPLHGDYGTELNRVGSFAFAVGSERVPDDPPGRSTLVGGFTTASAATASAPIISRRLSDITSRDSRQNRQRQGANEDPRKR